MVHRLYMRVTIVFATALVTRRTATLCRDAPWCVRIAGCSYVCGRTFQYFRTHQGASLQGGGNHVATVSYNKKNLPSTSRREETTTQTQINLRSKCKRRRHLFISFSCLLQYNYCAILSFCHFFCGMERWRRAAIPVRIAASGLRQRRRIP